VLVLQLAVQGSVGGQYAGTSITPPNSYSAGVAAIPPPAAASSSTPFQLDIYGCPVTPMRAAGAVQSSTGLYRRPAPYPSPQQYMLAKRSPFFAYQRCGANSASYPVRARRVCRNCTADVHYQ